MTPRSRGADVRGVHAAGPVRVRDGRGAGPRARQAGAQLRPALTPPPSTVNTVATGSADVMMLPSLLMLI